MPIIFLLILLLVEPCLAEVDISDGFTQQEELSTLSAEQKAQKLEALISKSQLAIYSGRASIDTREDLQKALSLAPNDYRPNLYLGIYYLSEVGHYRLANRYLKHSMEVFHEKFGSELDGTLSRAQWQENAKLIYLLADARLNLDDYQGSLELYERYEKTYWDRWLPGSKAWVLWKLGRTQEAIRVAQTGLLLGAEPGKTYNMLGILLSSNEQRRESLQAFRLAIQSEYLQGSGGQIATPLNNSGEVYRELFEDELAEASWKRALQGPDGCEHILPSLNLVILYMDSLRIYQAERVLEDFVACFRQNSVRVDSEHRSLLALARGRIQLHLGNYPQAVKDITRANDSIQWFGKIGTKVEDMELATTEALASSYLAQSNYLRQQKFEHLSDQLNAQGESFWLGVRAWWLKKRAREVVLDKLADFEDLFIRHTDSMLEYPSAGGFISGFSTRAIRHRIERMKANDRRKEAHSFYDLYLAENLLEAGYSSRALKLLKDLQTRFRPIDRLASARTHALLLRALKEDNYYNLFSPDIETSSEYQQVSKDLYTLHPPSFRQFNLALPVELQVSKQISKNARKVISYLETELLEDNFYLVSQLRGQAQKTQSTSAFRLVIQELDSGHISVQLLEILPDGSPRRRAALRRKTSVAAEKPWAVVNDFIEKAFAYQGDAPAPSLPSLPLLDGIE